MECPNCAFQNTPGLRACVRCQSRLDLSGVAVEPPRRGRAGLSSRARYRMHAVGHRTGDAVADRVAAFRAAWHLDVRWSTLLWSVIPGLGHVHAGLRRTGQLIGAAWIGLLVLALLFIGGGLGWLFAAAALGFHCFVISLLLARSLAQLPILRRLAVGVFVYLLLLGGLYYPGLTLGRQLVRVIVTNHFHDTPAVHRGDVLLYAGRWTRPRTWERGDLVVYRIRASGTGNIVIEGGFGLDRIVGVPGDHVVCADGVLTVNGAPVPAELGPLRGERRLPDLDFRVGDGNVAVLASALRWRMQGAGAGAQAAMMVRAMSLVPERDLAGPVWWRVRPWWRFGPVGPGPAESRTNGARG